MSGANPIRALLQHGLSSQFMTYVILPLEVALFAAGLGLVASLPGVAPVTVPVTISGAPATTGTVGTAYSFTPATANGSGTKTFALAGTLPTGLTFSTTTGTISGTPTAAGPFAGLNITVTDASGTASLGAFTIAVSAAAAQSGALDFSDPANSAFIL